MYKESDYYTGTSLDAYAFNNIQQPAFDGAATSYKNELKGLLKGEPDTLAARELLFLQMRSAHAMRNNGVAKSARTKYVTNLNAISVIWKDKKGKQHTLMQELWDEFAENPNLDGYGTLSNTQSVWHSSMFQSGNAFTRKQIRVQGNSNKIPLKLEAITPEFHDVFWMGGVKDKDPNRVTKHGITFYDTKPEVYHFRKGIFEQVWFNQNNPYSLIDIPATELLHMFIRDMPGQWIGIPYLSSIMIPLYELDELVDATVAKQQVAQAIAWIVTNSNPIAMTPTGTPTYTKGNDGNDKVVFKAQGGSTQYLNKGEDIKFYQSTDIGANLQTLMKSELRRIASALDIPYHSLTGDSDGLNFSSIRSLGIELRTRLEYMHHFYTIPLGLKPLAMEFKALAALYDKKTSTALPFFQLPRWYGADELKDGQSDLLEIQSGMSTLEQKLQERHMTFEQIVEDAKRNKELEKYGIDIYGTKQSTAQSKNVQANQNSSTE